jgi:hypothetical protein
MKQKPLIYVMAAMSMLSLIISILSVAHLTGRGESVVMSQPVIIAAPAEKASEPCLEIYGKVRGDVLLGSRVYLHQTNGASYDQVMSAIRRQQPIEWTALGPKNEFGFGCLPPGNYALSVPGFSYNQSVGYPLPLELMMKDLSLDVAFQGGDLNYAVGAFSIGQLNASETAKTKEICFPLPVGLD